MIDRQSIIDAIQDLQEQITHGDPFESSIDEIALDYGVPRATLIANIERVETIERFEARCLTARQYRLQTEDCFAPLREHVQNLYGRKSEP
ncbi:MAG: hypothetical protein K2P68_05735, partial [Sphingomonas sp.]|nr:hypothetical protein [Sphingomonas sp.]